MKDLMTLTLSTAEVLEAALGLSAAALSSANDDRLETAAAQWRLSAKLLDVAGYSQLAAAKRCRARSALAELALARVDDEEDVEL